jgi:hypothetical protein
MIRLVKGDHLFALLLKYPAGQLNTLGSFDSLSDFKMPSLIIKVI